jgi:transcription-repair coupling factor (superfamily II helicase)
MGGTDFAKQKARVRDVVSEIAQELVVLYQSRLNTSGYSFPADTPWMRELSESFLFQETPDQLTAIQDVLSDMESPHPMDRLICGDVGFGKTEIAMRAAFLAVSAGKQVAILVPTTLLAKQHHRSFIDRFIDLRVDYLIPGKGNYFIAKGKILRLGNKVAVSRMELVNDKNDLIALGTGTYNVG